MVRSGFIKSNYDNCVYLKKVKEVIKVYLILYVDNILVASYDRSVIIELKNLLSKKFDMKELGHAKKILGIDTVKDETKGSIFLSQENYLRRVLKRFNTHEAKSVTTPLAQHIKLSSDQPPSNESDKIEMESVSYAHRIKSIMYGMIYSRPG